MQSTYSSMNLDEFKEMARLLAMIDIEHAQSTGVIAVGDLPEWNTFRADPLGYLLRADEPRSRALWDAMMKLR